MKHPVFGPPPGVYTPSFVALGADGISPATRREFDDGPGFFDRFEGRISVEDLAGLDVLDLGCGFGGRTAYYALHGRPRTMIGLEIDLLLVETALHSAPRYSDHPRLRFLQGCGEQLPFADESFDVIFSYDVFEHVADLPRVLAECHRVLRPGGRLFAMFPPYFGPRAHHLDFITTLPFLHHLFSPRVLVAAANDIVERHPELERVPFPLDGDDRVLPTLNGTTERAFRRIVRALPFDVEEIALVPYAWAPPGPPRGAMRNLVFRSAGALLHLPWPCTRDVLVSFIRCVLRKPHRPA
ncbi:MAG TPA: class I SAM-dependent methyltransferase [Blastocatellia bacterium]|nr:class I SAM-dependent methyltransferase [Blastocatellia bacterium]